MSNLSSVVTGGEVHSPLARCSQYPPLYTHSAH